LPGIIIVPSREPYERTHATISIAATLSSSAVAILADPSITKLFIRTLHRGPGNAMGCLLLTRIGAVRLEGRIESCAKNRLSVIWKMVTD
jgi:hypothetical protein